MLLEENKNNAEPFSWGDSVFVKNYEPSSIGTGEDCIEKTNISDDSANDLEEMPSHDERQ